MLLNLVLHWAQKAWLTGIKMVATSIWSPLYNSERLSLIIPLEPLDVVWPAVFNLCFVSEEAVP